MASSLLHAGSTLDPGEPLHIQVKAAMHMIKRSEGLDALRDDLRAYTVTW